MKRTKLAMILGVLVLVMALLVGCSQQPQTIYLNVATGGTAGTYYPLGGAMAEIWNKAITGMNATAQSTGASVANVNLLKEAKADIIFVQNDIVYYAAKGEEMFKDNAYADIRGLATLYPETIQVVTKVDKKITKIADLKGKKVAVGAVGSGTEANARQILAAAGITYADINPQYLNFADAANSLKDGNIDAAFLTAGHPTAAVQDIAAQHSVVIVPIEAAVADPLIAAYPFYTKVVIASGTYPGVDVDVNTVAVKAMLAVSSTMSDATAKQLVEALYSDAGQERIKAAHKVGAMITKEGAKDGMPVELHAGAAGFFGK